MSHYTDLGGPHRNFPETRHSIVVATGDPDPGIRERAYERLIASYWKPAYVYVRLQWNADQEEAKDLVQGFFAAALEKGHLQRFDPTKARFRTYLRICVDGFVSDQRKAAKRLKRGGGAAHLSLDFESAEGELKELQISDGVDPDQLFHEEWLRHLFKLALAELRTRSKTKVQQLQLRIFERYDIEAPDTGEKLSYAQLAEEEEASVSQVTNGLHAVRQRFRTILLELLWESCSNEAEYRDEARELLGIDLP